MKKGEVVQTPNLKEKVLRSTLPANIPKEEYDILQKEFADKAKKLTDSANNFKQKNRYPACHCLNPKALGMEIQASYVNVPFRDERFDQKSTVASSGCAILIAQFLGKIFNSKYQYSVEELAAEAVKKGYRGYKKVEEKYVPMGCKHVFFDRFIPSLYKNISVKRATSVQELFDGLACYQMPVVLVKNSIYKDDPENTDSHFLVIMGFDEKMITVFDPEYSTLQKRPYSAIVPAIRIAWLYYLD